jgi:hypothetical protein
MPFASDSLLAGAHAPGRLQPLSISRRRPAVLLPQVAEGIPARAAKRRFPRIVAAPEGVEMLSRLTDYLGSDLSTGSLGLDRDRSGQALGPCLSVHENGQGGRVAVAGYYPWSFIDSAAKVWQYRALAQWLSRERLPAVVENVAKVIVWARAGANGRAAVVVLNASLDPQPELALRLRMPPGEVEHVPMEGKTAWLETELTPEPGCRRVAVPEVAPWSLHLLLFEQPPAPE